MKSGFAVSKASGVKGLKSEKRMIQSTDRKLIDVERGIKVDEEIKAEEAKLK